LTTYDVEAKAWQVASKVSLTHRGRFAFLRAYRRELQADPVKFDVATMIILIQIAIQIWKWAKDIGYFASGVTHNAIPSLRPVSGGPVFKNIGVPMGQSSGAYLDALCSVLDLDEDDDA
jgi:hypothetical protein